MLQYCYYIRAQRKQLSFNKINKRQTKFFLNPTFLMPHHLQILCNRSQSPVLPVKTANRKLRILCNPTTSFTFFTITNTHTTITKHFLHNQIVTVHRRRRGNVAAPKSRRHFLCSNFLVQLKQKYCVIFRQIFWKARAFLRLFRGVGVEFKAYSGTIFRIGVQRKRTKPFRSDKKSWIRVKVKYYMTWHDLLLPAKNVSMKIADTYE